MRSIRELVLLPRDVISAIKFTLEVEHLYDDCEYRGHKLTLIVVDGKIVGNIDAACRNNQIPFEKGFSQDENRVWRTGPLDNGKGGFYSFFIGEGYPGEGATVYSSKGTADVAVFAIGNDKRLTREQFDRLMKSIPIKCMPMTFKRWSNVFDTLRFMERKIIKGEEL